MTKQRENELPKRLDRLLGLLSKVYAQDGERAFQEILVNAKTRVVEETDYDNWNGGQWGHDVYITISEDLLLPYLKNKNEVEQRIRNDLNGLVDVRDEFVANIILELEEDPDADWRQESGLLMVGKKSISPSSEKRIWRNDNYRVFLSHKTEVKAEVATLKESLGTYGIAGFVAHEDIHPTQDWQNEIEAALGTADAFVAVLTERFHDSLWTDQEVGYALARGIPIIALRLGRDPYGFLGKFQALSCDWTSASSEIAKILIKQDRMVGAYVEAVAGTRSFNEANQLSELLPHIQRINAEGVRALVDAYNMNPEARGGFGFNGMKPRSYGNGLVFHLGRLGFNDFEFGDHREVRRKK